MTKDLDLAIARIGGALHLDEYLQWPHDVTGPYGGFVWAMTVDQRRAAAAFMREHAEELWQFWWRSRYKPNHEPPPLTDQIETSPIYLALLSERVYDIDDWLSPDAS